MEKAKEYREKMIEVISEFDNDLFEKFVEGQAVTNDEIRAGIRSATIALKVFPVICGSAFKNKGVQIDARRGGGLPAFAARRPAD